MFNPTLRTRLVIDGREFTFSPHPAVPTMTWGQEGRHAIVYRIQSNGDGYALKVFRPAFRHPGLLESARALAWAHELPGMRVCDQQVITRETHPKLVEQYEDLDYAMLMPWIDGDTWFDYIRNHRRTTLDQSRALAESAAWVFYALEMNQLAHCDLSSGNVIVDPGMDTIHLVDVEDLYSPWLVPPPMVPAGTPGYQHREVSRIGQWRPTGDRFAGAVLMAEMLGWAHPKVREESWDESYFAPTELQQDCRRYRILLEVLRLYDVGFAELFESVWHSSNLETCPPLKTWYDLLDALPREPVAEWAPINPVEFGGEPPARMDTPVARPSASAADSSPPYRRRRGQQAAAAQPQVVVHQQPAGNRRGCRAVAIIAGLIGLVCCYALVLAVQWSVLQNIF